MYDIKRNGHALRLCERDVSSWGVQARYCRGSPCRSSTLPPAGLATEAFLSGERSLTDTHRRFRSLLDAPWPEGGALCLLAFSLRACHSGSVAGRAPVPAR